MKVIVTLAAVALTAGLMVTAVFGADLRGIGGGADLKGLHEDPKGLHEQTGNHDNLRPDGSDRPIGSDDSAEPGEGDGPADVDHGDHKVVEAPIDVIDILVMESYPVQYAVHIVSGLPSGCAQFHGIEVEHGRHIINITITNTMPANDGVVCTMIYGLKEHNVQLGSDFVSGETYTVIVNGESKTFIAQ